MSEAIIMVVESVRTRASTSEALITLALPLEQADHLSQFMSMIGEQVGVAFAKVDARTRSKPVPKETEGSHGMAARALRLSGFFRAPAVWKAIGSDEEFLEWLRSQPCAYCNDHDYVDGTVMCEAAHVRRVSAGSGTSIKPQYSAVSLCRKHHDMQHDNGESSLGDTDWWAEKRIQAVSGWGWITLKSKMGYDSWKHVPPDELLEWCVLHEVDGYLPIEYLSTT